MKRVVIVLLVLVMVIYGCSATTETYPKVCVHSWGDITKEGHLYRRVCMLCGEEEVFELPDETEDSAETAGTTEAEVESEPEKDNTEVSAEESTAESTAETTKKEVELEPRQQETIIIEHIHSWDSGVVIVSPTCTQTGVIRKTCLKCGDTKDETLLSLGHDLDSHGLCSRCSSLHISADSNSFTTHLSVPNISMKYLDDHIVFDSLHYPVSIAYGSVIQGSTPYFSGETPILCSTLKSLEKYYYFNEELTRDFILVDRSTIEDVINSIRAFIRENGPLMDYGYSYTLKPALLFFNPGEIMEYDVSCKILDYVFDIESSTLQITTDTYIPENAVAYLQWVDWGTKPHVTISYPDGITSYYNGCTYQYELHPGWGNVACISLKVAELLGNSFAIKPNLRYYK